MAIHSNQGEFSVHFMHTYLNGDTEVIPVTHFVEDFNDWNPELYEYPKIKENVDLEMRFSCTSPGARCTMDGFDILPAENLEEDPDTGLMYMKKGTLTLFKHDPEKDYYPYIPGIYCITVCLDKKKYYSFVKVISSRMTDQQLDSMRREVEEQSRGLAMDAVRRKTVIDSEKNRAVELNQGLMRQFIILHENFREVSAIIADLSKKVRWALKKEYLIQPVEKPLYVDMASIQHRLRHPESLNYVKVRKNTVNYDLPENRMLKRIINQWVDILTEFCQQLDYNLDRLTAEGNKVFSAYTPDPLRFKVLESMQKYKTRALQMKGALNSLQARFWYQEISDQPDAVISSKMYADPRYNKILKIHRKVQSNEIEISLHPGWNFHWKRTDQLYEIWGFFQVLKAFKANGFHTVSVQGWKLHGENWREHELLVIPAIPKGTKVKMEKGDIKVNIVFDGLITGDQSETNLEEAPVYTTGRHNNPDVRVDVYIGGTFIGNLIMDTKYRNRKALENSRYQLISYVDNVRSPYIYNKRRNWHRLRPVHSVLVLYPDKWGDTTIDTLSENSIMLVPLTPETEFHHFYSLIGALLDELVTDAEDEGIVPEYYIRSEK